MKLITRFCVALFAMVSLCACEEKKNATLPTPQTVDRGIQRSFSYFHGPHDNYTRIIVEITGEETRVSEFGGNGPTLTLARNVGVKLFDRFLELKDIERFRHREGMNRETESCHLFWLYERDHRFSKYTVPRIRLDEIPELGKWLSDFLAVAANLKIRKE